MPHDRLEKSSTDSHTEENYYFVVIHLRVQQNIGKNRIIKKSCMNLPLTSSLSRFPKYVECKVVKQVVSSG